jgi:hypothetical protein
LVTRDFASISTSTISNRLYIVPTFGDIDTDGDVDMILGDGNGDVHWYENTAGAGNPCNFSNFKYDCFNINAARAYPQLFDVNKDGRLDLLVGTLNGRLSYYKNTGTSSSPSFSLVTSNFGGVNVNTNPSVFLGDGSCSPFMFDDAGTTKLLSGSVNGKIFLYDNIDGNLTGTFNKADTSVNYIYEGLYSTVQYVDINGDSKRDLITGNYCGGLNFYSSAKPIGISEASNVSEPVIVYPNPCTQLFTVKVDEHHQHISVELFDLNGKLLLKNKSETTLATVDAASFSKGIYLLKIFGSKGFITCKKLVLE